MALTDLIKPGPSLETDGAIDVWNIETCEVVAHYEGLEVHEKLEAHKKFEFGGNSWFEMVMDSICVSMCAHCGEVPHVTVDDDVRCCICGID